jgi:ribosomal protein L11 methylase PrmA
MARIDGGSFRDPSGFIFQSDGHLYRQVNRRFASEFDGFIQSGLYDALVREGLLVPHVEVAPGSVDSPLPDIAHRILEPTRIPFVSYPYEWSFSQLKDAALATLAIQRLALEHEHILRDASAYNVQFLNGRPIFIDTLSFEPYREGEPWVAYRQFCQHFLAPLALAACVDIRLTRLSRDFIDGVPLDLASRLLPLRTRLNPALFLHIHLHAGSQRKYAGTTTVRRRKVSRLSMRGLNDNLSAAVKRLRWHPGGTEWGDYYDATNYTGTAMESKPRIVGEFIARVAPRTVWDLGANTGVFSRIASTQQIDTIAFDVDPAAVEKNYIETRRRDESHLLPLVMDLTNPSPPLGWDHEERASLVARGPADMALALALIHHLAISNNVPLEKIARFLARICRSLVIEFVPKEDSQVKRLLATRQDIFPDYTIEGFTAAFARYFEIVDQRAVEDSERTLFLMRRRES